ncbi:MAG: hypothetical protein IKZ87_01580 [Actinomycetaceae bacterium]|nr:hypothetical protein [Actinomycetaceae bacterium]
MTKMKKAVAAVTAAVMMTFAVPGIANAATVYYKGTAVYWGHGRTISGLYGYSEVQSSVYQHHATVNGKASGWKNPSTLARAEKYIGKATVGAYWNCRG